MKRACQLGCVSIKTMQSSSARQQSRVACQAHVVKKSISCDLEILVSLSKTELMSMPTDLTFPAGIGISKDDLIKNVSDSMINKHNETSDQMLALIEEEEEMNVQFNL